MSGVVLAFQEFDEVVWPANHVEGWSTLTPVEPCWVDISMYDTMCVQVSHCSCQLSEDKMKSRNRKFRLAELLPEGQVLWSLCLEHDGIRLREESDSLAEIEQVWV